MDSLKSAATQTQAVRAGIDTDTQHHAVIPPLYLTSNYAFTAFGEKGQYDYTRSGNPTRTSLAHALADLEGGSGAVVTASGMAAVMLVMQLVRPGEWVIAPQDCYGGTYRLLSGLARRGVLNVDFVDQTDLVAFERALARRPKLVCIETPSNPLLRVTDLNRTAALAHEHGALVVADNTFLSPVWQQPIRQGADMVVHSTTKYLNGHSDVVGGAVVAKTRELQQELEWWANASGVAGAPFDSYLTLRGLRTLHARLRTHAANTERVVELLCSHPAVAKVHYPGLRDHPQHAIAARQQTGFGAMVTCELRGDLTHVRTLVNHLKFFSLAESLGGVESLVAHPASMTHAAMDAEARHRAGISDTLLRFSIGIEAADDLVDDLRQGLDRLLVDRA